MVCEIVMHSLIFLFYFVLEGFHIKFKRDLSMIEPVWIDSVDWPDSFHDSETGEKYLTCLRIPFDNSFNKVPTLRQGIEDVFDDRLILFLNKLQHMRLDDRCNDREVIHRKKIISSNWTRVSSTYINRFGIPLMPSECYWLFRSLSFNPQMKRLSTDSIILDSTEVYIAIKFIETNKENADDNTFDNDVETSDGDWNVHDGDNVGLDFNPKRKILEYDSNCGLLPIYAFLPTKTMLFNFIIQADFVLSSSREGILENDEWNLRILSHIPKLFKSIFEEMTLWTQTDSISKNIARNECMHINQLTSLNYDVQIKPSDIYTILPRFHSKMKESDPFYKLIEEIYTELSDVPFLLNIVGELTSPNKLFALRKDSTNRNQCQGLYKTLDKELFQFTRRHFIHPSCELDDELVKLLKIPVFDGHAIINCLTQLHQTELSVDKIGVQQADPQDTNIRIMDRLDSIVGWLLALSAEFQDIVMNRAVNISSRTIVPSTVITNRLRYHTPTSNPTALTNQMIDHLKILPLWYIQSKFQSLLEVRHIYVILDTNSKLLAYNDIIKYFKHQVMQLDNQFLQTADKLMENGSRTLLMFLLRKIPSTSVRPYGFTELSCDLIAQNVIFPAYKEAKALQLDRVITSAYLAFLFKLYSNDKSNNAIRMLKNIDMTIPVAKIKDMQGKHVWISSDVQSIRKVTSVVVDEKSYIGRNSSGYAMDTNQISGSEETVVSDDDVIYDTDVHLGVEFNESCTNMLVGLPIVTALKQLSWTILDPLASALALDQANYVSIDDLTMKQSDLKSRFQRIQEEKLRCWKEFLVDHVGLVDLFGIRKSRLISTNLTSQSEHKYEAPDLFSFLKHLTRNGTIIENTPQTPFLSSSDANEDSGAFMIHENNKFDIPLWLKYPEDNAKIVTKTVYESLCVSYMSFNASYLSLTLTDYRIIVCIRKFTSLFLMT
jgi:hypothetical protein